MSSTAREWLPDNAYSSSGLADAIVAAVERWAGRWFGARAPLPQSAPKAGAERRLAPGKAWQAIAPGVWLEWSEPTRLDYARLALDRSPRDKALGEQDRQLMALLAERMAADLGEELAALLGTRQQGAAPEPGRVPPRGLLAAFGAGSGTAALELMIDHAALAPLRRRQCPPPPRTLHPPVKLAEALGDKQVPVEAVLGAVRISALELKEIAVGDVVVIDRRETDLVELRPQGSSRVLAHAQLSRDDGNLTLMARMN